MVSTDIFIRLRALVMGEPEVRAAARAIADDYIPIEGTDAGIYVLASDARVLHLGDDGRTEEVGTRRATALLGTLVRRHRLATAFLASSDRRELCPTCNGTGVVPNLPQELSTKINCQCGGLGWVAAET